MGLPRPPDSPIVEHRMLAVVVSPA
jgi:hypothetical protein